MSVQVGPDVPAVRRADWYTMTVDEVAEVLEVDVDRGLPPHEVTSRQARYGPNALRSAPPVPWWRLLLGQFTDGLILVLLGAAALSLSIGEIEEAVFIAVLLAFNGLLGFWQERQAQKSLSAIQAMVVPQDQGPPRQDCAATAGRRAGPRRRRAARGRRHGSRRRPSGGRVPAGGRRGRADRRARTGRQGHATGRGGHVLADRTDMAFTHTAVTAGRAEVIVTATGMDTEIGKLATLMSEVEPEPTPLQRQTAQLGHRLALIAGAAVAVLVAIGLAQGAPLEELAVDAIALAVAAIPEALPATVTVTLAIGMSRLAKRRAVVKRLHAVETLGSTSVICSDKTGTLTLNQMPVRTVVHGGEEMAVEGQGYAAEGRVTTAGFDRPPPDLRQLAAVFVLCNDAVIRDGACIGDPTEGALLVLAAKAGIDVDGARQRLPRVGEVPFDSATKYMATFHEDRSGEHPGEVLVCVKGAAESVLERVDRIADREGRQEPLDDAAGPPSATPRSTSPPAASVSSQPPAAGSRATGSTSTGTSLKRRPA